MRNLTCGDLQILLVVLWLVLTRAENEEISYQILGSWFFRTCFKGCERPLNLYIIYCIHFCI